MEKKLITLIIISYLTLISLNGCVENSSQTNLGDSNQTTTLQIHLFSDENFETINETALHYFELRDNLSKNSSFQQLASELSNNILIKNVEIEENNNLLIEFSNGEFVIFSETLNETESPSGVKTFFESIDSANATDQYSFSIVQKSSVSQTKESQRSINKNLNFLTFSGSGDYDMKYSPNNNKILLMSAARESLNGYDVNTFGDIKEILVFDYGWDDSDVVLRYNEKNRQYKTLGFDDFINLQDFGVIAILSQGFYLVEPLDYSDPNSPLERFLYTQIRACDPISLVPVSEHFDVQKEIANKRIIPKIQLDTLKKTCTMYLYMRHDLWFEHLQLDQRSILYLMNCHSDVSSFMFAPKNVGGTLSWDRPVCASLATDLLWTIPIMAVSEQPLYEIWEKTLLPKISGLSSQLHFYPEEPTNSVYLPTWLDICVLNKPADCTHIQIQISYEDSTILPPSVITLTEEKTIEPHSITGLVPGEKVNLVISALDINGISLKTKTTSVELSSGDNQLTVNLPDTLYSYRFWEHTYTTQEEIESMGHNWNGNYLYRWRYWLVFDAEEGATSYKITVDTTGYPNEYMENNNPWTASGMPGNFFAQDDPTLMDEYEVGKRFFLIGGQDGMYKPDDGPSYWYDLRDQTISGVGNWTFNIVGQS